MLTPRGVEAWQLGLREAVNTEKSQNCGPFPSIAFGGVFPNITEANLVDEISTKVRIYPPT